jgi:hypothetical protein
MIECMSSMIGSFPSGVGCMLCSCENIRGIDYMWGNGDDDMNEEESRPFAAFSFSSTYYVRPHDVHIGVGKWSLKEKIGDEEFDVSGKVGNERIRVNM